MVRGQGMATSAADPHDADRVFHLTAAFVGNRAVYATQTTDESAGKLLDIKSR
jgi:hypothetical protein